MLETLELKYVGPAQHMMLGFNPRLNLLTGDNGLGKSFILDTAWWALSRTWPGEEAQQAWPQPGRRKKAFISYQVRGKSRSSKQTARFDLKTWSWKRSQGRKPNPGLVIYARVEGGFSVWDPARNYWKEGKLDEGGLPERNHVNSYQFSPRTLWYGLPGEEPNTLLCNGLISDWVTWQLKDSPEYKTLCEVLEVLSPGEAETLKPGEPVRLSRTDARVYPSLELPYGRIPIIHASAGARRILALAYLLVWTWHEHVQASHLADELPTDRIVLLIDELEAHLHPRWQRLVLPALLKIVTRLQEGASIQVIAATHAPLMLASVEPLFDTERDALFDFDLVKDAHGARTVQVRKTHWRPRGDANAWLVSDIFDLGEPRSVEAEKALEQATAALRDPGLDIKEVRRIHRQLHKVLKDTDPFWPRWELRARAAGIAP
ncbi:MAG TPA: AAA family ATPase [Archangium sp.]|uniref:AAA family ATPase n=1 Tax=Archangium sp. TaxID=1872627 RepID=UPI002E33A310|nr:AAA family ATPase [Archangium sp.]HEX5752491.1 AAA family ATPase [Archangium sp.]